MKRGKTSSKVDPNAAQEQQRYDNPIASREYILTLLQGEKMPATVDYLARKLDIDEDPEKLEALRRRLAAMQRDGQLIRNRKGGFVPVDADAIVAGRISAHPDGFGFLIIEDGEKDIYLNAKQMRQVLHNDRVVVCITGTDHRGRREGRIVEIVERANRSIVGRFMMEKGVAFIAASNKRIHQDVHITPGETMNANQGDMVVAEITEQPTRRHPPVGCVVEVLGAHLEAGMEIDVALRSHDIPFQWPEEVETQASGFSTTVLDSDKADREDVRDLPLVTIDGIDARDFDDAVYCEKTSSGWRLYVAIADVAHYVQPSSALDTEAQQRGTSVYFPGRVVPMLPEVLSNGLCSLNPDVDRLCMLCVLSLDEAANIKRMKFHNGLMRSHARLIYDDVAEILENKKSPLREKHASLVPHLENLEKLYRLLLKSRKARGVIEFASNETRIVFDENKKIDEIVPVTRNNAHRLIEECMILANIAAASFLQKNKVPALYRVHHSPKQDRLEDLREFLKLRSLSLGGGDSPQTSDYAKLSKAIQDRPDQSLIETVMLRSMQQAVYQPRNDGHFGLALEQYAHFTSPIRRYPDLLVHRGIKHVLTGKKAKEYEYSEEHMTALGEQSSMTERRADEATRDVVSWLKCEYMQDHVGETFSGVISTVTSFGLFVELPDIHVEGLIHITNLTHDYYRYEQAQQALVGERSGKRYQLGDEITVVVQAVDLEERKIDFAQSDADTEHRSKPVKSKNQRQKGAKGKHKKDHKRKGKAKNSAEPEENRKKERWSKKKKDKARKKRAVADKKAAKANRQRKKELAAQKKKQENRVSAGSESSPYADAVSKSRKKKTRSGKLNSKKTAAKKRTATKSAQSDRAPASRKKVAAKKKPVRKVESERRLKKTSAKKVAKKAAAKNKTTGRAAGSQTRAERVSKKVTKKRSTKKGPNSRTTKKRATAKVQAKKSTAKKTAAKTRSKRRSTKR